MASAYCTLWMWKEQLDKKEGWGFCGHWNTTSLVSLSALLSMWSLFLEISVLMISVSDQFYPSGNIHPLLLPDIPIVSPQRAKDFLLTVLNLFDHQGYEDNFDYIPEVRDGIYKVMKTNNPCSPHWKRKIIYDGFIWLSREHIQNYVKLQYTSELTPQAIRNILSDELGPKQAWHLGLINLDHQKLHFWQRHGNRQAHNILVVSAL